MPEGRWNGQTYYGRPQLKPAPFNKWFVGSYVFLAGLSGASQLLTALVGTRYSEREAAAAVRRGRYLAMLAPALGTICLILDLNTPRRFYNMLRVFKTTSPMSLGSWALVGFSTSSTATAALQFLSDRIRWLRPLRGLAWLTQLPAAASGSVLATYTASLFSATSTPRWAAAPISLAARFAAASVASAAAALSLGERPHSRLGRDLDSIAIAALATELAATLAGEQTERRKGISQSPQSHADAVGVAVPLALFSLSLLWPRHRSRALSSTASVAVLAASLAMRIRVISQGDASALQPEISMRFAQPDNLAT